ncbi:MAG: ribosome recycling factor [Bacteroidales bacterium]|nr:ribosome recycling factor [Bacteroidales bacterium]
MSDVATPIIDKAKSKMDDAVKYLEEDLKTYRIGKANPVVFRNVVVDYYGSTVPLDQVASITTPDAKTIAIQPWEKKMIPVIEKAIIDANIGFAPSNNGEVIRCVVPPITEENRRDLVKKARTAGENAKVIVRNARRDAVDALKKAQKEGLAEDMEKDYEEKVQKMTDAASKKIEELISGKEKEIMTV